MPEILLTKVEFMQMVDDKFDKRINEIQSTLSYKESTRNESHALDTPFTTLNEFFALSAEHEKNLKDIAQTREELHRVIDAKEVFDRVMMERNITSMF